MLSFPFLEKMCTTLSFPPHSMANKSISDLPEGMISEILVRLPVKSLLQCKSVCKPWLSLISTPHFVKCQLLRAIMASIHTPTLLTIANLPPTVEELAFDMKSVEMDKSCVHFDRLVMPPFFPACCGVVSSCNGIICLANLHGNDVYLSNPSIRKCKKLPASPEPYTSKSILIKQGFGYDYVSDAYKVLRIVCEKLDDTVQIVQLYSTSTDSWTEFRFPIVKNYKSYDRTNIVVNGVLYFNGMDELIAFDLHNEVFGQVPFPTCHHRKRSDLMNFQGSVAMVFQSESGFDLWTLDDVSDQVSWTKRFDIEADSETELWLTEYLGGDQFFGKKVLLNQNIFLYYVLYDYKKKETKFYKRRQENICAYLKYTETLVSLDGFEHVD